MKNIAIIYGGKSVEHDVSIITAKQVYENIDKQEFNPILVYIDKCGKWWVGKGLENKQTYVNFNPKKFKRVFLKTGENCFFVENFWGLKKIDIYAVINCCHGTMGEDGCLQGLLESFDFAYSGSDVLGSSLCMNKIFMKKIFEFHGLPIVKYFYLQRGKEIDLTEKMKDFGYPVFVKPANLGSSIGIDKCENEQELMQAIKVAFIFDEYVIIEKAVENLQEINCSVQKINGEVVTGELEEPISWKKFLTFEDKYISGGKKGPNKRKIRVELKEELERKIVDMSISAYKHFNLDSVVRIDYLYDKKQDQLYINEINTIPGSLAFYLWKGKGISFKKHISLQIEQAINKLQVKKQNKTNFNSEILKQK